MKESTYESEVDVTSRSGTNTRPERERPNIGKERADKIREKLGLGPDAPIVQPLNEMIDKCLDEKILSLSPEDADKWRKYLNGVKMRGDIALPTALERVKRLNLLKPGPYQAALNAIEGNKYEFLELCDTHLRFRDKDYVCVHARLGKSPEIKKIADSDEGAARICDACNTQQKQLTREEKQIDYIETLETRAQDLESRLETKATEVFKIPKCNAGALLGKDKEDRMVFNNCRKHPSGPVSVDKFCRVRQNGSPCFMYAEVPVAVGAKI